jgi:hypothetical protein
LLICTSIWGNDEYYEFSRRKVSYFSAKDVANQAKMAAYEPHEAPRATGSSGELNLLLPWRKINLSFIHWQCLEKPMPETEIKRLLKSLGESINKTLADSQKIDERLQEIRDAGYEVFLVIEAKIGFSRKSREEVDPAASDGPVRLRITKEDVNFLNSLKISSD